MPVHVECAKRTFSIMLALLTKKLQCIFSWTPLALLQYNLFFHFYNQQKLLTNNPYC